MRIEQCAHIDFVTLELLLVEPIHRNIGLLYEPRLLGKQIAWMLLFNPVEYINYFL